MNKRTFITRLALIWVVSLSLEAHASAVIFSIDRVVREVGIEGTITTQGRYNSITSWDFTVTQHDRKVAYSGSGDDGFLLAEPGIFFSPETPAGFRVDGTPRIGADIWLDTPSVFSTLAVIGHVFGPGRLIDPVDVAPQAAALVVERVEEASDESHTGDGGDDVVGEVDTHSDAAETRDPPGEAGSGLDERGEEIEVGEPSVLALLGIACLGLAWARRRRVC